MNGNGWVCTFVVLVGLAGRASAQSPPRAVPLDDFEAEPKGWKFVGGEEFPGAKGGLVRDTTQAHGGKASYRLDADFRGGGAYVGVWKDLDPAGLPDVEEFRLWVRAANLNRIGVRLVDGTGQCHQGAVTLPPAGPDGWREVVLKLKDLVGGEHWSGANDGKWHGGPAGLGLNVGKDSVGAETPGLGTLWIDDLSAVVPTMKEPTVFAASASPTSCRPGFGTRITYRWDAEPTGRDCTVFVHFRDATGRMAFQGDHAPPVPTATWSGKVDYTKTLIVPTNAAEGEYQVILGLYDPKAQGGGRKPLKAGPGVGAVPGDPTAYRVGSFTVSNAAPLPKLAAPTLNLDGYKLTFDEDFQGPLSISAWGPGTRWIAHTPYSGDFGDAGFGDPGPNSPFSVSDGILKIEAKKVDGRWRSGLICSVDPKGQGFSQKFGYFEIRAKLPKGLGTWPAFWLMGVPQLVEPRDKKTLTQIEIDVVEQYGVGPNALHTTVHLWGPGAFHWGEGEPFVAPGMTEDFHTYGCSVEEDMIIFYFDGVEIRRCKTPKEAKVPLYLMVDLALGGGWPIDRTPNPSVMLVDYVRAYSRK